MLHIRPFSAFVVAARIGLIGLAATATPAAAYTAAEAKAPMSVTLARSDAKDCGTNCPEWIALTGKILPQTPPLLRAVLARTGTRHLPVLIDSPGGAVEAAIAMGRMIRARGLDVAVAGMALTDCAKDDRACLLRTRAGEHPGYVAAGLAACASACVLVLAAGTDRVVGRESYVGVHQMTASRTLTHVINTFRIMRRLVNGHPVEVSRTLIATRPVSSQVVLSDAPAQTYTEVDKYLLGMGIGEPIMPLMRATPRAGIHWMTPAELASTRISTDSTDAQTLVRREAEAGVPRRCRRRRRSLGTDARRRLPVGSAPRHGTSMARPGHPAARRRHRDPRALRHPSGRRESSNIAIRMTDMLGRRPTVALSMAAPATRSETLGNVTLPERVDASMSAPALPYRPNVGIALFNAAGLVFAGHAVNSGPEVVDPAYPWQMPQGGIDPAEDLAAAARRELWEETGIAEASVLAVTEDWWSYDFPPYEGPPHKLSAFRGQTQRWVALRFEGDEAKIDLSRPPPGCVVEFTHWAWMPLHALPDLVMPHKRASYRMVGEAFRAFAASGR